MKKLLLASGLSLAALPAVADEYTVLLDWFFNPDHGPLMVAEALGYFDEAGLEITLIEPADPTAPVSGRRWPGILPFLTSPIFIC